MLKHTPGPWSYISYTRICEKVIGPDGLVVADPWWSRSIDEVDANARLIAAAPELLQALRGLADECELAGHGTDKDFAWPERMKAARAAIEKATGSV